MQSAGELPDLTSRLAAHKEVVRHVRVLGPTRVCVCMRDCVRFTFSMRSEKTWYIAVASSHCWGVSCMVLMTLSQWESGGAPATPTRTHTRGTLVSHIGERGIT